MRTTIRRAVLLGVLVAGTMAALSFYLHWSFQQDPNVRRFTGLRGQTEAEVRSLLGSPHRVVEKTEAQTDYYEKGYTFERRRVSNRVLIYLEQPDLVVYVYIDEDQQVEHVFVGVS